VRRIIITGDDFGFSSSVNRAIIEAHERGVLTNTSLMVTGEAFEEAVALAREHPKLGVGLHLVLTDGAAVLPPVKIPHIVDDEGRFRGPFAAGVRYQCHPAGSREVRMEIRAQLEKFQSTGLPLSHVDGHKHMHMPPIVLDTLALLAAEFSIRAVRLPAEELVLALQSDRKGVLGKSSLCAAFGTLRPIARRRLKAAGIRTPERVYGLFQTGRMTEDYWLKLIPQIRANWVEVYTHPTFDDVPSKKGASRPQLEALVSRRVREAIDRQGFRLATYNELN
jgi:hopanoid biosynthesis associated protein HpnK